MMKSKKCYYCYRPPVRIIPINIKLQGLGYIDVCIYHYLEYQDKERKQQIKTQEKLDKLEDRELRDFYYKKKKDYPSLR